MTVSPRTSKAGRLALHAKRKGANGAGILGDVFADRAIAAGDGLREFAVAIVGGHGESVQLELGDVTEFGAAEQFAHAAVEIAELRLVRARYRGSAWASCAEP